MRFLTDDEDDDDVASNCDIHKTVYYSHFSGVGYAFLFYFFFVLFSFELKKNFLSTLTRIWKWHGKIADRDFNWQRKSHVSIAFVWNEQTNMCKDDWFSHRESLWCPYLQNYGIIDRVGHLQTIEMKKALFGEIERNCHTVNNTWHFTSSQCSNLLRGKSHSKLWAVVIDILHKLMPWDEMSVWRNVVHFKNHEN